MVTARPINVERALVDPRAVFKEPIDVLACADLDAAHKRQILECWHQDALELQAAERRGHERRRGADAQACPGCHPHPRSARPTPSRWPAESFVVTARRSAAYGVTCPTRVTVHVALRTAREMRGKGVRPARAKPPLGHCPGMGR